MTIEQLEKANNILRRINELKDFRNAFIGRENETTLNAEVYALIGCNNITHRESSINLKDFPEIQDFVSGYLNDKITELEKQLEEL